VIDLVTEADLPELLPLMRSYCDFYEVAPGDDALLAMARELIADPVKEGLQLIARDEDGRAVGFATIFWTWSTTRGGRVAIMNDLFVAPDGRGQRLADALIGACADTARRHGALALLWQTAPDNERAQAVYDRVGATRSTWVDYELDLG
jgi:GNAT superfamily N-acetyltransferase